MTIAGKITTIEYLTPFSSKKVQNFDDDREHHNDNQRDDFENDQGRQNQIGHLGSLFFGSQKGTLFDFVGFSGNSVGDGYAFVVGGNNIQYKIG